MEGSSSNNTAGQTLNWRTQISQEARRKIVGMMMGKHLEAFPIHFPGLMNMIQDNAVSDEDKTYMIATSKDQLVEGQMFEQGSSINIRRGSIDRISNLPVDLLYIIMSFLPALDLVLTGILSTRWRRLWTSSKCLNIDVNQFGRHRGQEFRNFINCMLHQRGSSSLDVLRLHSADIRDAGFWITYAIRNNSKVVEFSEDIECEPFKLDHGAVSFTSIFLKHLVLTNVCLDSDVFSYINNACPALENLELRDCSLEVPKISSGSLLHLDIDNCCLFEDLIISSPSLLTLCIKNPQHRAPMTNTLPCLEVGTIILNDFFHSNDDLVDMDEEEEQGGEKINHSTVGGLTKARSIELIAPLREDKFEMELWTCPIFNNLTSLILGEWCMSNEFTPLLYFLWYSPLLEDLTLKLNMEVCQYCLQEPPTAPSPIKAFTADCLKKITIYFLSGDGRVSKLLALLAPICKSLEDIKLIPSTPPGIRELVSRVQRITE
uniref:F-box domain-containing protein n=1 Tax=Leersia perrieri TaxID=77586 RepID=A0A0D9X644_9ORYZ